MAILPDDIGSQHGGRHRRHQLGGAELARVAIAAAGAAVEFAARVLGMLTADLGPVPGLVVELRADLGAGAGVTDCDRAVPTLLEKLVV
jgi:hypothetical protein